MIASLRGKIIKKDTDHIVLEVGGVGYKVTCPIGIVEKTKVDQEVFLNTYTQVREDILALYGFLSSEDLSLFELLISVSGVGPKAACNILSAAPSEKIISSIKKQDPGLLFSVSGIGRKTAEKIVVELKNKLGATDSFMVATSATEELYAALGDLGFKPHEINEALSKMPENIEGTENMLRYALKEMKK